MTKTYPLAKVFLELVKNPNMSIGEIAKRDRLDVWLIQAGLSDMASVLDRPVRLRASVPIFYDLRTCAYCQTPFDPSWSSHPETEACCGESCRRRRNNSGGPG
jgi:hypothetical protein